MAVIKYKGFYIILIDYKNVHHIFCLFVKSQSVWMKLNKIYNACKNGKIVWDNGQMKPPLKNNQIKYK